LPGDNPIDGIEVGGLSPHVVTKWQAIISLSATARNRPAKAAIVA
jgi:hypothetical protein